MLTGRTPFELETSDVMRTFDCILAGEFSIPSFVSEAAADLILKLLKVWRMNIELNMSSSVLLFSGCYILMLAVCSSLGSIKYNSLF